MSRVYFIRPVGADGPVKIGHSLNPAKRLVTLLSGSAVPLEIVCTAPGGVTEETRLHRAFREHRMHSEWFNATPELLALIETVRLTGVLPPQEFPPARQLGPVEDIFAAFDGAANFARAFRTPLTSVCSWQTGKRGIPAYRREAVLKTISAAGKRVAPETIEYLTAGHSVPRTEARAA